MSLGTRTKATASQGHQPGGSVNGSYTRDVGMSKIATAAMTFNAANGQVSAANGTFAAFAGGEPVFVAGTNLNDGEFQVSGIDAVNGAFLVLDPFPKAEGPVNATLRTQ